MRIEKVVGPKQFVARLGVAAYPDAGAASAARAALRRAGIEALVLPPSGWGWWARLARRVRGRSDTYVLGVAPDHADRARAVLAGAAAPDA